MEHQRSLSGANIEEFIKFAKAAFSRPTRQSTKIAASDSSMLFHKAALEAVQKLHPNDRKKKTYCSLQFSESEIYEWSTENVIELMNSLFFMFKLAGTLEA